MQSDTSRIRRRQSFQRVCRTVTLHPADVANPEDKNRPKMKPLRHVTISGIASLGCSPLLLHHMELIISAMHFTRRRCEEFADDFVSEYSSFKGHREEAVAYCGFFRWPCCSLLVPPLPHCLLHISPNLLHISRTRVTPRRWCAHNLTCIVGRMAT